MTSQKITRMKLVAERSLGPIYVDPEDFKALMEMAEQKISMGDNPETTERAWNDAIESVRTLEKKHLETSSGAGMSNDISGALRKIAEDRGHVRPRRRFGQRQ